LTKAKLKQVLTKFAWRTSPRKRTPPSPRTPVIHVPKKKKRLEELFNEDSHDTKEELSVLCSSTADDNLTAETKDTAYLKDNIAESEGLSGESLKMKLCSSVRNYPI